MRDDTHTFNDAPQIQELKKATANIEKVMEELLRARLNDDGFLKNALAVKKKKG